MSWQLNFLTIPSLLELDSESAPSFIFILHERGGWTYGKFHTALTHQIKIHCTDYLHNQCHFLVTWFRSLIETTYFSELMINRKVYLLVIIYILLSTQTNMFDKYNNSRLHEYINCHHIIQNFPCFFLSSFHLDYCHQIHTLIYI